MNEVELMQKAIAVLGGANAPQLVSSATVANLYESLSAVKAMDQVPGMVKATFGQSGSATSGFTAYDLEAPGKLFYPVLTPLRNMIPRVSGKGGIQAAWRAITAINTANLNSGVSEGNRGGVIGVTFQDYIAAYRGIGFESTATFEAQYAADTFDDVRKRAAQTGLHSLMISEEKTILAGNGSLNLGTTATPSLSGATTGGTLVNQTWSVICVGLTLDGYLRNGGNPATNLLQQYTRQNADGSSDVINGGVAQKSAAATVATTGTTSSITATVTAQRGALAYAWFWGLAGSETFGAVTTAPKVVILAAAAGTQLASALTAADYSVDGLAFDGLLTQALKSGSNAYWQDLGGATLTPDGNGGVVEIEALLKDRWDNFRLNPEIMWISSREAKAIKAAVLAGNANGALRFNIDAKQGMLAGGMAVATYLNEFGLNGATEVQIRQHPNMPPGTILFTQSTLPYPLADTPNVMQIRTRQDYYQIEWPWRSRKYEYGVYADQVLQHMFPPALGVITGIGGS